MSNLVVAATGRKPRGRGFGSLSPQQRQEMSRKGGKAAHEKGTSHEFTSASAKAAGRLGGLKTSKNREHMAAIGKRGGAAVSADREHMAEIGRKGGRVMADRKSDKSRLES